VLTPQRLVSRHHRLGGKRSKVGASEGQLGAGLEESEALAPARPAGGERGAVAGAAGQPGLLPPPRRGLRGALRDQRASHAACGNAGDIFSSEEGSATHCTGVDRQPNAGPAGRGLLTQTQSRCLLQSQDSTGPFAPLLFLPHSLLPCQTRCSTPM